MPEKTQRKDSSIEQTDSDVYTGYATNRDGQPDLWIPADACADAGISISDQFRIVVDGDQLLLTPTGDQAWDFDPDSRNDSSDNQHRDVDPQTERFLDTAVTEVDELSLLTSQFVDNAESGDATERDLLDVHCRLISASIAIRDAAHTADVVDTDRARYHQINDLLSAVAHACRAQRRDPDVQHRRDGDATVSKIADAVDAGLDAGLIDANDAEELAASIQAAADRSRTDE